MKELKIVALSDTHNRHKQIKSFQDFNSHLNEEKEPLGGDIIIHAGDATARGEPGELERFIKWYSELDFSYKVFVPGNHDFGCENNSNVYKKICEDHGVIYLNHDLVTIEGINIFGSPWTPYFYNWAFNGGRTLSDAAHYKKPFLGDLWAQIPENTNILVTHGPPYGVLDELVYVDGTPKGQFVGCEELMKVIKKIKPDIHIFGHIHCGYGVKHIDGTSFYNAAICDEMYSATNAPHIITYVK